MPPSNISPIIIETDGGTEVMRVDPTGNVGIGTASPNNQLVNTAQASFGGNTSNTGTEPIEVQGPGAGVSFYDRTSGSTGRWVIYSDGETLRLWSNGDKVTIDQGANLAANSVNTGNITAGIINTNGEVVVNNASGTATVVLDGNGAMIDVGASGADGGITVYDKTHTAVIVLNGQNGKLSARTVKATAGGVWGFSPTQGVAGYATQAGGVGVRAQSNGNVTSAQLGTDSWAGDFSGGVNITGGLVVSGFIWKNGGGFRIDHPLDPVHKYLAHSFVESPDMKNIYDGVAVLDAKGEATVELPEWFAALNRDLRYQLTCIGDYAPVYIAQKMQDNRFKIAGGKPEMEVCWQVTGIRQDAWACAHRFETEEEKPTACKMKADVL